MHPHAERHLRPHAWPMNAGAEALTAAQFARCGFDVLVAGCDRPWYDLVITKAGTLLRVSVRASENGCWCLTEPFLRRSSDVTRIKQECHTAIDLWLGHHGSRTVCCLVQFEGVLIQQLPRIYLASPVQIAQRMRETADRIGNSTLFEQYEWTPACGNAPSIERLPASWRFSNERIQELQGDVFPRMIMGSIRPHVLSPAVIWSTPTEGESDKLSNAAVA
jgi:hypothetical protein